MTVVYNRVALIGLGLIASSMFWSIRRGNLAKEVVGYAKSKKSRDIARSIGLCDQVCDNLKDTVGDEPACERVYKSIQSFLENVR